MKNYKKGLLTLAILSTMSLMAADDKTIYVNTFDDEDGTNLAKCSLREALKAAEIHQAYGGCSAGQVYSTVPNVIQLEAGEYKLTKELRPNSNVTILGKQPADYSRPDVLTNNYPATTKIQTTISGQGISRIFNTIYDNKPSISLNNLILKDGSSLNDSNNNVGGAIYAGGATTLTNVNIVNAKSKNGGAIYLNDATSSLTINKGVFDSNDADQGSVLGMTCSDNLVFTPRTIGITGTSFINNGSTNSRSTFSFCGQPDVTFTANTITQNTANPDFGSIIQFSQITPQGSVNFSDNSSLILLSNTIVRNNAWATLLYGFNGAKTISNNILAYNNGKSCRYANGDVSEVKNSGVVAVYNALTLSPGNDQCELANSITADGKDHSLDVSNINFSTILYEMELPPTESTGFMPMYFPKNLGTDKDLVDIGYTGCSDIDQRGITRVLAQNSNGENDISNSCDIGSTEVLRLTANNISATNTSVTTALTNYQNELDIYNKLIADPTTNQDYIPFYKIQSDFYSNLIKYTKSDQKYRTIFVDPFIANLPAEILTQDASGNLVREVKHLSIDNYDVTATPLGIGMLTENKFEGSEDPKFKCEWDANLKRVLLWRTDDAITPSGDNEFCRYTLTLKSDPSITSSAYLIGTFVNIAPTASDATLNIEAGSTKPIDVDLLQYANDDGDGDLSALTDKPNKPKFYVNSKGVSLPIRIGKNLDPVIITADQSGPCPGTDSKYTCYSGKVHIQLRNTLDPFSYKFTYYVYDADGAASNAGTITLANSGTASGSPRVSGGGSFGWLSLVGLIGLAGYRRNKMNKKPN